MCALIQHHVAAGGTRVAHKTMDGSECAPKWGVYNRHCVGHTFVADLGDMCIGRSLESVQSVLPKV